MGRHIAMLEVAEQLLDMAVRLARAECAATSWRR